MRSFFQLTRNERFGVAGMCIVFVFILLFKYKDSKIEVNYLPSSLEKEVPKVSDQLAHNVQSSVKVKPQKIVYPLKDVHLHPFELFNPNEVSSEYWEKIGLQPKMAKRAHLFIQSGSGISRSSDLLQIYGFQKEWIQELEKYLVFKKLTIDLNAATASEFQSIRGIGEKLSNRIIRFREKLGGFVSTQQLYQVYGLDSLLLDNTMERFDVVTPCKRILINSVSLQELESHLYLNAQQSEEIIKLRSINGTIDSSSIRNIFTLSEWRRIKPYFQWSN
ncbi:MAG: hypothetical protein CMP61_11275 [Flavobacteriales bacterium]|nr:hypothetical protein [Flavobacteriales bacterium]|tara:strand:+ start:10767 stop:11594 length:828 start_codon:yes stop_codon:yes gene_type:complete